MLITIIIVVSVGELLLRLFDKPQWTDHFRVGWKYLGDDEIINQLDYRGSPIDYNQDHIVVVLLGDSQVESSACSSDSIPEQLLEAHLRKKDDRYRVYSLGSRGYGVDQQLLALQQYMQQYRADQVLLWQTFNNDVWNTIFPTNRLPRDGNLKPTFHLEKGKLIGPNYQLLDTIMDPPKFKIQLLIQRITHPQNGMDQSWEKYLPAPYTPMSEFNGVFSEDLDPMINPRWSKENFENEKSHYSVFLTPRGERMQYGLDLSRTLMKSIQDLCEKNNSNFGIFYTYENETKTKPDTVIQKINNKYYITSQTQFDANQSYLNEGFQTFKVPIMIENWRVSDIDSHLNCRANDQVMRLLADSLISRNAPTSESIDSVNSTVDNP